MNASPVIGIVGSHGAYGRWLTRFFRERMRLTVLGHDPAWPQSEALETLLHAADVLLFATPIRATAAIIADCVRLASGREAGRLWLDVTSIKQAPVQAMLAGQAEVVGLHPMAAPPKGPTLRGRVIVVCEARLAHWRGFVDALLAALEGDVVNADPARHDALMAQVQACVHALHLAQAQLLRDAVGDVDAIWPYRSLGFELDLTVAARMLGGNPAIYEGIQFDNPAVAPALRALIAQLQTHADDVDAGEAGRARFRQRFSAAGEAFGATRLAAGDYGFERIGYLLADLADPHALSVHLPEDRPGSLSRLLAVFSRHAVNLASIHSSRTPAGEVHFRLGFAADTLPAQLAAVRAAIADEAIGRVLD